MEYTAVAKSIRIAPRKVRLIADAVRKQKSIVNSLTALALMEKRASGPIEKIIDSAIANAVNRGAKKEELLLKSIEVMGGPAIKRFRPSTRGRVHPYKKRSSHIKITLEDKTPSKSLAKIEEVEE